MSNLMHFLESLSHEASPLTSTEFAVAVAGSGLPRDVQQALLARDIDELKELVGARAQMLCMIVPAENDEPAEEVPAEDEGDDVGSSSTSDTRAA